MAESILVVGLLIFAYWFGYHDGKRMGRLEEMVEGFGRRIDASIDTEESRP